MTELLFPSTFLCSSRFSINIADLEFLLIQLCLAEYRSSCQQIEFHDLLLIQQFLLATLLLSNEMTFFLTPNNHQAWQRMRRHLGAYRDKTLVRDSDKNYGQPLASTIYRKTDDFEARAG